MVYCVACSFASCKYIKNTMWSARNSNGTIKTWSCAALGFCQYAVQPLVGHNQYSCIRNMIALCIFEVGTTRVFTTKSLGLTGTNPEQRIHLGTWFNQFRGLWERLRFLGQLMSKTTCNFVV